jgi:hypothetical protein
MAEEMLYRKLSETGDMALGQGEQGFVSGLAAMEQSIATRLKTFQGEWWEEDPGALPMMTDILGLPQNEKNKAMIDLLIIARITDTVGVVSVHDVKSEYAPGRKYIFSCKAKTTYGEAKVEVEY